MDIDPAQLSPRDAYQLLIACVIPRPIAWIRTVSASGDGNLAPFSFFGGVSSDPPIVMVSIGRNRGTRKDTARNLLETGEAVVHIPGYPQAGPMVQSSAPHPPEVDEATLLGLGRLPSLKVRPERLEGVAVAMEARRVDHREVGNGPVDLFMLEIVHFHIDDRVVHEGLPSAEAIDPVGRLGGQQYSRCSLFTIPRPA